MNGAETSALERVIEHGDWRGVKELLASPLHADLSPDFRCALAELLPTGRQNKLTRQNRLDLTLLFLVARELHGSSEIKTVEMIAGALVDDDGEEYVSSTTIKNCVKKHQHMFKPKLIKAWAAQLGDDGLKKRLRELAKSLGAYF